MTKNQFGPTYNGHYPDEMRTQLWPLCCGARILSGFKAVGPLTEDKLVEQINHVLNDVIPDHQVFKGEQMMPHLTFLTLNSSQMQSPKIMEAIKKAGFVQFATGKPRHSPQGFFVRDTSGSFETFQVQKGKLAA